jgi:hypothetical protein
MENKIGFFEEAPGQRSSNRLIFIVGSFYAMAMGAWVFATTADYLALIATVTGIASIFIGGKLIQKSQENKV